MSDTVGDMNFLLHLEEVDISSSEGSSQKSSKNEDDDNLIDANATKETLHPGFIASLWMTCIRPWISALQMYMLPGTYEHFLFLLLGPSYSMNYIQSEMQLYLNVHHKTQLERIYNTSEEDSHRCLNKTLLASEIQMLRKLLEPIRTDAGATAMFKLNWIEHRSKDVDVKRRAWKQAAAIIGSFRSEIEIEVPEDTSHLSLNSPKGEPRSTCLSSRLARLDACEASILDPFNTIDNSQHFTGPGQVLRTRHSEEDRYNQNPSGSKEFMIMTACWLAEARCSAAVSLFCDVAGVFVYDSPGTSLTDSEVRHLRLISTIDPCASLPPHMSNPWTGHVSEMSNAQYFRDCAESQKSMMETICNRPPIPRNAAEASHYRRHWFRLTSYRRLLADTGR